MFGITGHMAIWFRNNQLNPPAPGVVLSSEDQTVILTSEDGTEILVPDNE